jgi:tetratricopeptide (TPR) repeat protein
MSESIEIKIRDAYQHQKHYKCVELIDSLPKETKESSQYRILKASCLNNIPGRSKEALELLDSVINGDPNPNPLAMFGKGLCLINEGNFSEAVKCFGRAIELEPSERMDKARAMKERAEKMMLSAMAKRKEVPKPNENMACKVCGKNFTKNFSLSRHMLLHTGERPFHCSICKYGFIQKSDLLRHEATHKA